MVVAYDGTAYHGWQEQPAVSTVVGELKRRFREVFGRKVTIIGASRTDAGVHALGQVALVKTDFPIEPQRLRAAWNALLPADIHIRSLVVAEPDFHPQRNVLQKTYWYHISTERMLPFFARSVVHYRFPFAVERLEAALQLFVGTHDFRSFCTGDELATVRTIDKITVTYHKKYRFYRIAVQGQGFARYMIRRLVGAALFVAARPEVCLELLTETLQACDPLHKLPTAPAHGLVLRRIVYCHS